MGKLFIGLVKSKIFYRLYYFTAIHSDFKFGQLSVSVRTNAYMNCSVSETTTGFQNYFKEIDHMVTTYFIHSGDFNITTCFIYLFNLS